MLRGLILGAVALTFMSCSDLDKARHSMDAVDTMQQKTSEMSDGMKSTNESIRQQKMLVCLDGMKSNYSLQHLYPIPSDLMPYAKTFAEAVRADEISELAYLWLKEIDEVSPLKNIGPNGKEVDLTPEQQSQAMVQKFGRFQGLMAIAGFLPEQTVF